MNRLTIRKHRNGFLFEGDDGRDWWTQTNCAVAGMAAQWLPGEYVRMPKGAEAEGALAEALAIAEDLNERDARRHPVAAKYAGERLAAARAELAKMQAEREGERVVEVRYQDPDKWSVWDGRSDRPMNEYDIAQFVGVEIFRERDSRTGDTLRWRYAIGRAPKEPEKVKAVRHDILPGWTYPVGSYFYRCGHCNGFLRDKYSSSTALPKTCPNCGRELDWSDTEEDVEVRE